MQQPSADNQGFTTQQNKNMTDREALLERARKFESTLDADRERQRRIRDIEKLLSKDELELVHDEARIRAIQKVGVENLEERPGSYEIMKSYYVHEVIGEWYIDQQKPFDSRVTEQVEA